MRARLELPIPEAVRPVYDNMLDFIESEIYPRERALERDRQPTRGMLRWPSSEGGQTTWTLGTGTSGGSRRRRVVADRLLLRERGDRSLLHGCTRWERPVFRTPCYCTTGFRGVEGPVTSLLGGR